MTKLNLASSTKQRQDAVNAVLSLLTEKARSFSDSDTTYGNYRLTMALVAASGASIISLPKPDQMDRLDLVLRTFCNYAEPLGRSVDTIRKIAEAARACGEDELAADLAAATDVGGLRDALAKFGSTIIRTKTGKAVNSHLHVNALLVIYAGWPVTNLWGLDEITSRNIYTGLCLSHLASRMYAVGLLTDADASEVASAMATVLASASVGDKVMIGRLASSIGELEESPITDQLSTLFGDAAVSFSGRRVAIGGIDIAKQTLTRKMRESSLRRDLLRRIREEDFDAALKTSIEIDNDYRRSCPRKFVGYGGYNNPRIAHVLTTILRCFTITRPDERAARAAFDANEDLIRAEYPLYFVEKRLAEDLRHTDLPSDITMGEINLPVPNFAVLLPKSVGGHLVAFGKTERGVIVYNTLADIFEIPHDKPIAAACAESGCEPGSPSHLALNVMLAMACEPDWFTVGEDDDHGTPAQTASRPPRKSSTGIGERAQSNEWHPNFFGGPYRRLVQSATGHSGEHASPRAHIRRGHWKGIYGVTDKHPTNADIGLRVKVKEDLRRKAVLLSLQGEFASVRYADGSEATPMLEDVFLASLTLKWIKFTLVSPGQHE